MRTARFHSIYAYDLKPGDLLRQTLAASLRVCGIQLLNERTAEPTYNFKYSNHNSLWWTVLAVYDDEYIEILSHYNHERGFVHRRDWDNFELVVEQ